ncbi:hypothetical protein AXK11_01820 [Cephaloticoccus primus]|uniref:Uncharacterized protein n=1 Tax=Cephaloticoccus primus TaxID=1548207 RepID=A0A139STJ7_9BACT|nr:hypothetical protein [Cephaloticoccus primus]KXU37909.1 hypothetical protein AXK11_01820 [Cephaloticoccus primus]
MTTVCDTITSAQAMARRLSISLKRFEGLEAREAGEAAVAGVELIGGKASHSYGPGGSRQC